MTDTEIELADLATLFKGRDSVSSKQVETLSILRGRGHLLVVDLALELCTSPQAAGRTAAILCRKGLVYEDFIGMGQSKNHLTLSPKGIQWVLDHNLPV